MADIEAAMEDHLAHKKMKRRTISFNRSAGGSLISDGSHTSVISLIEYDEAGKAKDHLNAEKQVRHVIETKRKAIFEHKENTLRRLRHFKFPVVEKDKESTQYIIESLSRNILFKDFTSTQIKLVAKAMTLEKILPNTTILTEGDEADHFYLVQSGDFWIRSAGKSVGIARGGDTFGDMALFYNTSVDHTIRAKTAADVWTLDGFTLRQIIAHGTKRDDSDMVYEALKRVTLFQEAQLKEEDIRKLVKEVSKVKFNLGDTIIRKGSQGEVLYLIVHGYVRCTKIGTGELGDLEFGPGDYFGERSLLTNELRAANVIAVEEVECLALDRSSFNRCFGSSLKDLMSENMGMRTLRSFPVIASLSLELQEVLVNALEAVQYEHNDVILKKGESATKLYIVLDGTVEKRGKTEVTERMNSGEVFGVQAMQEGGINEYDVIAIGSVMCCTLDRASMATLPASFKKMLNGTTFARNQEYSYNFEDFELLDRVGHGAFGVVRLARHPDSDKLYALKILNKQNIVRLGQQKSVFDEKEVLLKCDHPFILKLYKTFQDSENLYLLTDYLTGGTLFRHFKQRGAEPAKMNVVVFYVACIVSAIEHLHARNIVYRDLKQENIMIDNVGYAKLIDFGFAKSISTTAKTFCGTPEYMAPEVVARKPYGMEVDRWALGVLFYELIDGISPFFAYSEVGMYRGIKEDDPVYSNRFTPAAQNLCSQLLNKVPEKRLSLEGIKKHEVFSILKWEKLLRKQIRPPWVPKKGEEHFHHRNEDEEENIESVNKLSKANIDDIFLKF